MKRRRIQYSAAELAFLQEHCAMPRRALHAAFVSEFGRAGVAVDHIKALCTRRGWDGGRRRWLADDDAQLRALYPDTPTGDVARRLGRAPAAVYSRARQFGLRKSDAYLASPAACRLRRGDSVGAPHRFKKGHVPANKGLRRPGFAPGRMNQTQFKKGVPSRNTMPLGSERLIDGYRYTKFREIPNVTWVHNWKTTHVLLWEAKHGPIAKGMALKNLDGNRLNVEPSNWTLIPRAMLPLLTGIHGCDFDNAPAELKPSLLAIAKLRHAARKRARGSRSEAKTYTARTQNERPAHEVCTPAGKVLL